MTEFQNLLRLIDALLPGHLDVDGLADLVLDNPALLPWYLLRHLLGHLPRHLLALLPRHVLALLDRLLVGHLLHHLAALLLGHLLAGPVGYAAGLVVALDLKKEKGEIIGLVT